ncbi:uncharacterized protein LOC111324377 [Stylophora pistillata]|uniref:Uncharacterized protein n=1 Tax=Stylophora pistillata TaxID=50429 RepID=A0A2B4SLN2_STYPI|nr:uncharacterized protein LOC111324377 [Stylophora pistillata]XP_022783659.1 uncharacterized protein LOC111324377 [Stylophora pistillata]XP_022783660.1 uncharacterized protein LOC111324377 [Stylophora pistillata]XP_022783661.1 uncharacterized protein LOC111324377 [Stylophora pistillata]XP_022783662.1 uncharacterized protein LOC111324377 [Stylophora pistillata]PFX29790.1 hypothetical protein AWC38_SpisGene5393 [Stylophora pistillata]
MVSSRCKKRLLVLAFCALLSLLFLYKVQQERTDYVTLLHKQTKDFSGVISNRDKSFTTKETSRDKRRDKTEDDDDLFGDNDNDTDQELKTIPLEHVTEPPRKIHKGLEGNDEVEDTLDWLNEHGVNTPSSPSYEETALGNQAPDPDKLPSTAKPLSRSKKGIKPTVSNPVDSRTSESQTNNSHSSPLLTLPSTTQQLKPERVKTPSEHREPSTKVDDEESATVESSTNQPLDIATAPSSTQPLTTERDKNLDTELNSTFSSVLFTNATTGTQQDHSSPFSTPYTSLSTTGEPTPVYTPTPEQNTCKLPKLDPWDFSIKHLLKDVGNDPGCRNGYPVSAFDVIGNRLVLSGEGDGSSIDFNHVKVHTIHRDQGDDNSVHYENQGNPFKSSTQEYQPSKVINASDFLILDYKLKSGKDITTYLARAVPQQDVIEESKLIREKLNEQGENEGLGINVLLLGIDSVSAANFRRKMPKTLNYLKTALKTYFMSGQTVVGDATTPALTALLTGLYETEPPEGRQGYSNSAPIDKWPWIMKLYRERGYVTMMAEDDPTMGAFNLRLMGFEDPPAHHYMRPFWLALENKRERDEPGLCSRSTFMVNYTLDYILSYFAAYPDTPKFTYSFMSYLAHAHPNHLSYADNDILRLLHTFVERNHHNNTMIVLFGDHGSRNDEVRNTMQGKLEERLPWLSISIPDWLIRKFPPIGSALQHNQGIISSPFDMHATLRHILTYPKGPEGEKTQSLFTPLSVTRTCSDAGVDDHWCPCLEFTEVDVKSPNVVGGAEMVVKYINDVILNRTELLRRSCAEVQLKKIVKAVRYKPNDKLQRFSSTNQDSDGAVNFGEPTSDSSHYRINFMTSPGDALFEASLAVRNDHKVIVNPSISRTNVYGNQPSCILRKEPYARKFCYCKDMKH